MVEIKKLHVGDHVRNKMSGVVHLVLHLDNHGALVAQVSRLESPEQWDLVRRAAEEKPTVVAAEVERFANLEDRPPAPKPSDLLPSEVVERAAQNQQTVRAQTLSPFERYEFIGRTGMGNSSRKFWEIRVEGTKYVVRFGRIGTDGQISVKECGSEGSARIEARKITQSKLDKGYKRVN